jgi:hypothetical protein
MVLPAGGVRIFDCSDSITAYPHRVDGIGGVAGRLNTLHVVGSRSSEPIRFWLTRSYHFVKHRAACSTISDPCATFFP